MTNAHLQSVLVDYLPAQLKEKFNDIQELRDKEIEFERIYSTFKAFGSLDEEYILKLWQEELELYIDSHSLIELIQQTKHIKTYEILNEIYTKN